MKLRVLILAVALTACQPPPNAPPPVTTGVSYICASAGFSLRLATALFDRMTPAQRNTVDESKQRIDPVCRQDTPPTLSSTARALLESALADIGGITKGIKQ